MIYNRIIKIQKLIGNQWTDYMTIHAAVNKASGGEELEAGSFQSQETLQCDVRFCLAVAAIRKNTQLYQVVYDGDCYKITDYDDFKERHGNIRLKGVCYHG